MRRRRERGSASVEFALVLPIVLVLTLAVVQVGLVVRDDIVLVSAARAGAREAAVTDDDERVRSAVDSAAAALDVDRIDVTISRAGRGGPADVKLTYPERLRVPFVAWLFPSAITLHAASTMRQEFG
ncbi:MAG: TadE family protein [Actinomycetota bacterium]